MGGAAAHKEGKNLPEDDPYMLPYMATILSLRHFNKFRFSQAFHKVPFKTGQQLYKVPLSMNFWTAKGNPYLAIILQHL